MMFFAGMSQLLLVMAWWALELRYRGAPLLATSVAPTSLHPSLLVYGAFAFFIFDFLLTVCPRWLNTEPIPRGDDAYWSGRWS